MQRIRYLFALILICLAPASYADTFLYMAEEDGCYWCERWDEELSAIYPKSPEGEAAPLKRFDIHDTKPKGVTFKTRVSYTPTFILVRDGQEIGRIEGYPGEDFFWALLGQMMTKAKIPLRSAG